RTGSDRATDDKTATIRSPGHFALFAGTQTEKRAARSEPDWPENPFSYFAEWNGCVRVRESSSLQRAARSNSFTVHARAGENTILPAGRKTKSAADEDGGCALSNETRGSFCAGERRDADHALAESGAAKSAPLSVERRCLRRVS